jgi:hypothetical protein
MNWHLPRFFRPPSYLEVAAAQLDEAQRDLLTAQQNREYYAAMEVMLQGRITRLASFVAAAAVKQHEEPAP